MLWVLWDQWTWDVEATAGQVWPAVLLHNFYKQEHLLQRWPKLSIDPAVMQPLTVVTGCSVLWHRYLASARQRSELAYSSTNTNMGNPALYLLLTHLFTTFSKTPLYVCIPEVCAHMRTHTQILTK